MKLLFTIVLFIACRGASFAATDEWKTSLQQQLKILETSTSLPQWEKSSALLKQLADQHPGEWLLQYYAGWSYTQMVFQAPDDKASSYCKTAEPYVEKALALQPTNTETLTLKAYWLSARIKVEPTSSVKNGPESKKYSEKAIEADPSNPRAYLLKALVVYHTPGIFGGGKKKAHPIFEEAQQKFAAFKPKSALHPTWGLAILQESMKSYQ
ncbi:hypothetical protein LX64_01081 [Chitinophaga skermanii]|uniref:Tetratricopeptide repeat protein n=1 Tax=Chitinophaga skermanii TaxID=331697 RepID=A0A327QVM2_9BACT|nr:hypothetical protein [Chitinophaga skermanii]RAJ08430.1 hypothetical protein LX64_01081 [Chitinophaga skermanii]